MKKTILALTVLFLAPLLFLSQQSQNNNVNGFTADRGSFEILSSYQGKRNVLKVDGTKTQWNIARYPLSQYRGKLIEIEFSADVRREGSAGDLLWQVNNPPYFPYVTRIKDAAPGQWHSMKGRIVVTPTQNDAVFYMTNEIASPNTFLYIANPVITITEGDPLTPDLSLTPLKKIYENNFLMGALIDPPNISGKHMDLFKHHYNVAITNGPYPINLAPPNKGGAYNWALVDSMINLIRTSNVQYVHGHVLVYPGWEPAWMTEGTREEVEKNMKDYITAVMQRYRGTVNSWNVVNEVLKPVITNADARRDWRNSIMTSEHGWINNNGWYTKLGADFIEIAFRAARAADPDVTLYFSDFDCLESPARAELLRKMILEINDKYKRETGGTRNLIEGLAIQVHIGNMPISSYWNNNNYTPNLRNMRKSMNILTGLGIELAITEVDVLLKGTHQGPGQDTRMSERDAIKQARIYAQLFQLFREYSDHIKFVTFWDLDDNRSWLSAGNPTLFDRNLNAKKAFYAVSDPDGFLRQNRR